MTNYTTIALDRKTLLDRYMTSFSLYIKEHCPDAKIEISFASYDGEDGHVKLIFPPSVPDDEKEKLGNQLAEKSIEILLESGILILVEICDIEEQG